MNGEEDEGKRRVEHVVTRDGDSDGSWRLNWVRRVEKE